MVHTTSNKIKGSSWIGEVYLKGNRHLEGSWRLFHSEDEGTLCMQIMQDGVWISKSDWTNSYESDRFVLSDPNGGYGFYTDNEAGDDKHVHNLIRPAYTDGKGFVVGNADGKGILYSNASDLMHKRISGSEMTFTLRDGTIEWPRTAFITDESELSMPSDLIVIEISFFTKTVPIGTRYRLEILDSITGVRVYENCSEYNFKNYGKGFNVTVGENSFHFDPHMPIVKDRMYTVKATYSEDVVLYGDTESTKVKMTTQPIDVKHLATFPRFKEEDVHAKGDKIWKDGSIWMALENGVTGIWDSSKWKDTLDDKIPDAVVSPDGQVVLTVDDNGAFINNVEIATANSVWDGLVSPDGLKEVFLTDLSLTYNDGNADRIDVNNSYTRLYGQNGVKFLQVAEGSLRWHDGAGWRLVVNDSEYTIRSPDRGNEITLTDADIRLKLNGTKRIKIDANYTNIYSPGGGNFNIGDAGLYYNGATVQTSVHKGVALGLAELDASGTVPLYQLPGFVDEIIEYDSLTALEIADPQEVDVIYLAMDTSKLYRFSGTAGSYAEVSSSIAIGTTSATAYRGDRGKIGYDHANSAHAPSNANYYAHPSGDGGLHIPANGTGNTGKVLTSGSVAGEYSWQPANSGNSDRIVAPNTDLKMIVEDDNLTYQDDTYVRLFIDVATTSLYAPDGQRRLDVTSGGLFFNDGTRNRFEINDSGGMILSPNGTESLIVDNNGAFYSGTKIATVDDLYAHPTGNGNLHVPANVQVDDIGKFLIANSDAGDYTWEHPHKIRSANSMNYMTVWNDGFALSMNANLIEGSYTGLTIKSPDGAKTLVLTDSDLKYTDTTGDRFIISPTGIGMFSSDGTQNILVTDSGAFYNGVEINTGAIVQMRSPDGNRDLTLSNQDLKYNDSVRDRVQVTGSHNKWISQGGLTTMMINDTQFEVGIYGIQAIILDRFKSQIKSPSGSNVLMLDNGGLYYNGVDVVIEAPIDGNEHVRKDGEWAVASSSQPAENLPGTVVSSVSWNANTTTSGEAMIAYKKNHLRAFRLAPGIWSIENMGTNSLMPGDSAEWITNSIRGGVGNPFFLVEMNIIAFGQPSVGNPVTMTISAVSTGASPNTGNLGSMIIKIKDKDGVLSDPTLADAYATVKMTYIE